MTSLEDYFKFTLGTFKHRSTRSWLTIIGILIGIAAVVALISLGQGLYDMIAQQFEQLGVDKVIIFPGAGSLGPVTGAVSNERFTEHDVSVVERAKGVEKAVGMTSFLGKIRNDGEVKYSFVLGYDPDELEIGDVQGGIEIEKGRELRGTDKFKIVIGYRIANGEFFDEKIRVGDQLTIQDVKFEVVGTASEVGNRQDDTQIYTHVDTVMEIRRNPGFTMMWAVTKKGYEPGDVADNIKERMRRDRGLEKGKEDFTVTTVEQLAETLGNVIGTVQAIVIGIASISLIVGGIGIMNTMYASVLERTREIGIMKAVGARNSDIVSIFLIESGMLGLAGGILGVGLGAGAAKLIELIAIQSRLNLAVVFPLWLIGGALAFSFIVGSLSGALPALKAAKLRPTEALRYE